MRAAQQRHEEAVAALEEARAFFKQVEEENSCSRPPVVLVSKPDIPESFQVLLEALAASADSLPASVREAMASMEPARAPMEEDEDSASRCSSWGDQQRHWQGWDSAGGEDEFANLDAVVEEIDDADTDEALLEAAKRWKRARKVQAS